MKEKRKFDVILHSQQDPETTDWTFSISLRSVFADDDFYEDFKKFEQKTTVIDPEHKDQYIEMVYNFLKNNLGK